MAPPTSRRSATNSTKPQFAAKPTTSIFRTPGKPLRRLTVNYGLRYEVNSRIHEADEAHLAAQFPGRGWQDVPYWDHRPRRSCCTIRSRRTIRTGTAGGRALSLDYAFTQSHRAPCRRSDYHNSAESVAGQFSDRRRFPSFSRPTSTRCPERRSLSEHARASDSADALYNGQGQLLFPRPAAAERSREHADRSAAFPERPDRTHAWPPGAVAIDVRHRQEFSQRIHRKLDGGHRPRFRRREVQRCLRGHRRNPPGQRLFSRTATPAPTRDLRRSRSSIPQDTPSEASGRKRS